jgi:regulatory protein
VDGCGCGANGRRSRLAYMGLWGGIVAKITALKYQKKNPDRVSVYLDGRFAFGVPAIVAIPLKVDQVLSDAEIEEMERRGGVEKAYNQALNFLSYRPRSRAEVVTYLEKKDIAEQEIEIIAERLERAGLIDDMAFAQYWVENRVRFRPKGPRALRYELRLKGIQDEVIDQALVSVDVSAGAYQAAAKKVRQLGQVDSATFRRKIIEYLARRGFDYQVARESAERHWKELDRDE